MATVELLDVEETDAAIARARAAFPAWRAVVARRPGPAAAPLRRGGRRRPRAPGPARGAELRAHHRQRPLGGRQRPRRASPTTPAAPERLIGQQIPVADGIDVTFHEPLGVVGVIVPWNFPMPIAVVGLRAGAGGRQHRGAQAGRAHPADRACGWPSWRCEAGLPGGRLPGAARQGQRGRPALRRPPRRRQDRVHRLDRGRPADHGRLRRAHQAGDPRTRRQERQRRLRRRRPRGGRRHRAVRGVRQRRPGLLRPLAHPGRAQRVRPVHGAASSRPCRASWSPTRPTRRPRWAR